jgi:F0F1-type ATP synthase assembly protein I
MPLEELETNRSFIATAVNWASRVTSIALEMVVPPVLGLWIDRKLDTGFVFVSTGAILGFCAGMLSLIRLAKSATQTKTRGAKEGDHTTHNLGGM